MLMQGKTCIVTGSNSGIGKETALGLARMGARVVMVCRDRARGEEAQREIKRNSGNEQIDLCLADLSSQQEIRQVAQEIQSRYPRIDVLINNAGTVFPERQVSRDGIEMTFAVNHLAVFLLTNLLLETLKASAPARIVNVSSSRAQDRGLNLDDLQSEKTYSKVRAYAKAKLAMLLFSYDLARRLAGTDVTVNCLHPGYVGTQQIDRGMPSYARALAGIVKRMLSTPEQGAQTSLYLATSPDLAGVTGKYFDQRREKTTAPLSYDTALQEQIWKISASLTDLDRSTVPQDQAL